MPIPLLHNPTTDRYRHGILGDTIEANQLSVINESGSIRFTVSLDPPEVFETRYTIWADVNNDGQEELTVTVSSPAYGASVRIYDACDGSLLSSGAIIGGGNRWQHLLGWLKIEGKSYLAMVRTPHIGGSLLVFTLVGGD